MKTVTSKDELIQYLTEKRQHQEPKKNELFNRFAYVNAEDMIKDESLFFMHRQLLKHSTFKTGEQIVDESFLRIGFNAIKLTYAASIKMDSLGTSYIVERDSMDEVVIGIKQVLFNISEDERLLSTISLLFSDDNSANQNYGVTNKFKLRRVIRLPKYKLLSWEEYTPNEDVILSLNFEYDLSIDIVSIDKHIYGNDTTENGFEAFLYRRDGSGDYEPMEHSWKTLPTKDEILKEDFSQYIDDRLEAQGTK